MPIAVLKEELKKSPKVLRTCRHNKHPIVMNPSYIDHFEEYKMIGINKLKERADIIKKNKKFAEKVELILRDEAQEKAETQSQEDIFEEESLYNFPPAEDNKILLGFHQSDWDKKIFGKNFGKSGSSGNISADFRPIPATKSQLKFQKYGIFWYF